MKILPGSRYCFTREVDDDPVRLYEHLLIHHRRRQRRLEARWSYGLFPVYIYEKLPEGFQVESPVMRAELSEGPEPLLEWAATYREGDGVGLLKRQREDTRVHLYLWNLFKGQSPDTIPAAYRAACRSLVESRNFGMVEPAAIRVGSFLSELVAEGVQAEEGSFSLESSRAREKLSSFQLADPQEFYLHAVAGAVAGGAPEVEVYVDADEVVITFKGQPLDKNHLENLFSSLLAGRASGQERELAVALNAALSLRPSLLQVDSRHGGRGWRLSVGPTGEKLSELEVGSPQGAGDGHRLHFRARPGLQVARRFVEGLKGHRPEHAAIAGRFTFAPVPIRDQSGRDLRFLPGPEVLTGVFFEHPQHPMPALEVPEETLQRRESPWEASVLILFGPPAGVHWMTHGLLYEPPAKVINQGLWVLVSDSKASRDLSFSHIVKDRKVEELAQAVNREIDLLLQHVVSRYARLPEDDKMEWVASMQQLLAHGASLPSGLPLYKQVAGGLVDRATVLNRYKIHATERDFEHPLRGGEPAYVMPSEVRALFDTYRVVDATEALQQTQVYQNRRREWMEAVPPQPDGAEPDGRFAQTIRGGTGSLSLLTSPQQTARVEFLLEGRILHTELAGDLPRGLKVALRSPDFDRDWEWKAFLWNEPSLEALKDVPRQLAGFYDQVFRQGASLGEHGLEYLLYLKNRGEDWRRYQSDLILPTLTGGAISLKDLMAAVPWGDLPLRSQDFDDSFMASVERRMAVLKRVVAKATVPWDMLYRVWELKLS